jgi:para-nitrobenzyl esterase
MKAKEINLVAACAILLVAWSATAAQVVVQTANGRLQGSVDNGVASFKGVPFAQPPVGDLRLKAPQPAKSWTGIRKADAFSAGCMQHKDISRGPWVEQYMLQGPISEDCLYLNVWAPANLKGRSLPVYVWFYGGGYTEGAGSIDVYNGANLARRGLIVVTVNYRLGALGFLALPQLSAESPNHASGNYGFLDGVAALQWLKDNIAAFGGDPAKVTIGGQSAGSGMVHNLCVSPLAKGLFRAAVAESGTSLTNRMRTLAEAEKDGLDFIKSKNVSSLDELRRLPAEEFIPAPGAPRVLRFSPILDGWAIPGVPLDVVEAGKANDVPPLTGMQADEGSGNAPQTYGKIPATEWHKQVQQLYGDLASKFEQLYPSTEDAAASIVEKQSARDRGQASMYLWCSRASQKQNSKIYTYYFNRATPWPEHPEFGAHHTGEVIYMFSNLDKLPRPYTEDDRKVAATASGYLVNYVRTADPNGTGLPKWESFKANPPQTLEISPATAMRPLMSPEKLAFWKDYFGSPLAARAPVF